MSIRIGQGGDWWAWPEVALTGDVEDGVVVVERAVDDVEEFGAEADALERRQDEELADARPRLVRVGVVQVHRGVAAHGVPMAAVHRVLFEAATEPSQFLLEASRTRCSTLGPIRYRPVRTPSVQHTQAWNWDQHDQLSRTETCWHWVVPC